MKILYAGSPESSAITLQSLLDNQKDFGFEIVGVLTNPPSAKGRKKELTPTAVGELAEKNGLPVFSPEHLDASARDSIRPLQADLLVSFAYGHIFGPKFLSLFPMGGVNIHPSLLPKYRGCTPVPAAILNKDKQTAVTIQTLALKMDEGDILAQEIIDLDGTETAESLLNYCAKSGAELLCTVISSSENGHLVEGKKQEGEPSYTGIISKEDGKIDWAESVDRIEAKIRAYYPNPSCWCLEDNNPLKILQANILSKELAVAYENDSNYESYECGRVLDFVKNQGIFIKTGHGILCVTKLQRQGKNVMNHKDFMNGARNFIGTVLK